MASGPLIVCFRLSIRMCPSVRVKLDSMPLVGAVGRKRARSRFAMGVLYVLLSLGALTTLYPFLIMVSTGFKGPTDQNDNKLIPSYWREEPALVEKYIDDKYAGNAGMIAAMNREGDPAHVAAWNEVLAGLEPDEWIAGFRVPPNGVTSRLNLRWQGWLRDRYKTIESVNSKYIELNAAFQNVSPPPELLDRPGWQPNPGAKWNDWLEFKRTLPAEFRIPITRQRLYQEWLRGKYKNNLSDVPEELKGGADAFETIALAPDPPPEFLEKGIPAHLVSRGVDHVWPGSMPIRTADENYAKTHPGELRREFSRRNYAWVLDYILLNGRALTNTLIFCALAILVQLIVNPLAAYALSRFPMRATAQILLFLLATMAFPAEVAMIPSFLLLKDLGLLNTFAALVLPAAASGYMIFLLKGFFDSLPREVFESGQIDGAPETTMMLRIAFPLSRPVLGYLALLAFMGAYGAFMYAFLVAQSREMWTLSVFIYQLQGYAPKPIMMAAITLAALPTLIVFLFAQKVIMRGIVLPGER